MTGCIKSSRLKRFLPSVHEASVNVFYSWEHTLSSNRFQQSVLYFWHLGESLFRRENTYAATHKQGWPN